MLNFCLLCINYKYHTNFLLQSDFAQGIVAMSGANIVLEDCTFENFYSGIVVHKGAQVCYTDILLSEYNINLLAIAILKEVLKDYFYATKII